MIDERHHVHTKTNSKATHTHLVFSNRKTIPLTSTLPYPDAPKILKTFQANNRPNNPPQPAYHLYSTKEKSREIQTNGTAILQALN